MSHAASAHGHGHGQSTPMPHGGYGVPAHVQARSAIDPASVEPPRGLLGKLSAFLLFFGGVSVLVTIISAMVGEHGTKHALASYHAGVMYALGLGLGCLGFVMISHQTNAGWSATIRRQFENIASVLPVVFLFLAPVILLEVFVFQGKLFKWMNPALTDPASPQYDTIMAGKAPFLNSAFWLIRCFVYFGIWTFLSVRLYRNSRAQDESGDVRLTQASRRMSSWGLMAFALTTAFAAFDYLMSLDYHFFSTMWGVYYFAGSILSAVAACTALLCILKVFGGKLGDAFTPEHLHDLAKLIFAFTVFWAYITFSQYFLIWYSNIPEETSWFYVRTTNGWTTIGFLLSVGQFIIPFLILLFRPVKRNFKAMLFISLWVLVFHGLDMFYIVRPQVKGVALGENPWVDVFGILGPVCLFLGLAVARAASAPLIPLKDPRLHEALGHRNYV